MGNQNRIIFILMRLKDALNERKYYVTYNRGRGQGKGLEKEFDQKSFSSTDKPKVFNSYNDAKKYAEKMEKMFQHSIGGGTAYWVSDEKMNPIKESVNESDLKGYLVADVVDDIVKSIGSKFVSGEIKNAPNKNKIYLKLKDVKFGSGVVKILKSRFGIDAKEEMFGGKDKFGSIPSVSFFANKVVSESVNKTTLNEGLGDSIKKIRNLAIKMASTKFDRAKSHLNIDKIASADEFDGTDAMNKATSALLQQTDLDEDLKSAINKIAVKLGTGATMMGIITALVSMSGWIQYLDSSFTKWYYTEIQKLAEPEVMKVMQDLGRAGQAEGSIYGKLGMYAFFIFFTIAVISLVAARMTKGTKKEYVDKKGVERVAAALPQTEEEPIKECKTCNSK
jgi:hypothetical protein